MAISGLKNAFSHKAVGLFKAIACIRAKDVMCFRGKTATKEGSKSFSWVDVKCQQKPRQFNAHKME